MHAHTTSFQVQVRFREGRLGNGQFVHHPRLAACVPDDMDLDACLSAKGNLPLISQEAERRLSLLPPLTFLWRTSQTPADVIGEAAVQISTEGEIPHLLSVFFYQQLVLPSSNFPKLEHFAP